MLHDELVGSRFENGKNLTLKEVAAVLLGVVHPHRYVGNPPERAGDAPDDFGTAEVSKLLCKRPR